MNKYSTVHRQQLFSWIGRRIEKKAPKHRLNDKLRREYVNCLRDALNRGLWLSIPEKPDHLGDGSFSSADRPMVCFTEWALLQSKPHTTRYGRLALGFPKRFVLDHGGQPITYVRAGAKNSPYATALREVAAWLEEQNQRQADDARLRDAQDWFRYLVHFSKRIHREKGAPPEGETKSASPRKVPSESDVYKKQFGRPMEYLEEREWRIVYDPSLAGPFEPAEPSAHGPRYYLRFKPGKELFTVVLPDNRTVRFAMEDEAIRQALFPAKAPPVTVLSLDDIGTF